MENSTLSDEISLNLIKIFKIKIFILLLQR